MMPARFAARRLIVAGMCVLMLNVVAVRAARGDNGNVSAIKSPRTVVRVAVLDNPPYASQGPHGFEGPSVEAFRRIAADNNWDVDFKIEKSQDDVIGALITHQAEIGIGHLNVTPERSLMVQFSDPDEIDALALMVRSEDGGFKLLRIAKMIFNWDAFFLFGLGLIAVLLGGRLITMIESRRNPEMFPTGRDNAWWAAQTMIAHNCGHKLPFSERGRYIAMLLMLGGTIFTAQITAVLTTDLSASIEEDAPITEVGEIGRRTVATVHDSYGQQWLQQSLIRTRGYKSVSACVAALERQEVSAVVYDRKALHRVMREKHSPHLKIVGATFGTHPHAIMLNRNSPYLAAVNRGIAKLLDSPELEKLFGD